MKPKSNLRFPLAVAIAALLAAGSASATTITWDSNGATALQTDGAGVWLTAGQWWDGAANVNWITGDDAVFGNAGVGGAVTLASPTIVNSLTLNSFTGTYTLGTAAQTITLNNGITKNTGAGAATIISPVTLTAAQSWNNNSAGLLTVGTGAVNNAGFLLTLGGSGNTTVSSVISGAGGLTKADAGIATLTGANIYGGVTTVSTGTLVFRTLTSKPATGPHNFAASTTLGLGVGTGGFTTTDVDNAFSGTMTGSLSNVTVDATTNVGIDTTPGSLVYGSSIATATRALVKLGVNDLTLTGTNDYTGGSTVVSGSLVFRTLLSKPATGAHAFGAGTTLGLGVGAVEFTTTDVDDAFSGAMNLTNLNNVTLNTTGSSVGIDTTAGDLTYSTSIGATTLGLVKFGANKLTLSGSSAYTGATTISGGTLSIASVAAAGASSPIGAFPSTAINGLILNNSILEYTGPTASTNRGFTNISAVSTGNSTINVATPGANLTMGDFTQSGAFITLTVNGGAGSSLNLGTYNYNIGQNQNIATNIPVSLAAISSTVSNGITVTGPSLLTVGNVSGTGFFLGGGQILITGTVSLSGNLTNNQGASTITYTGTSFAVGGLRMFDGNTFVVGGSGTLGTLGTFASPITFRAASTLQYNSSANQILSGNFGINTSNGGKLTMSGSGTLTLTGTNTVIGLTTVSNGTLKYGRQLSLFNNVPANWTAANINVQSGGTLAFNVGGTNEFTTGNVTTLLTNLADSSSATSGMNAGSRFGFDTTNAAGGTFTIADVIADSTGANGGARGLTKLGAGSLVLTNTNTYNGATTVNAGTLVVNGSNTGSGNVSVTTGTLGGSGSVTGAVTIGNSVGSADAILAPGNSIDSLDTGNLTFNSDGSYVCEVDGSLATTDQTNVTGSVTIDAATTLAVSVAGTLTGGQEFFIVVNDGGDPVAGAGAFSGLAQDAIVGNYGGTDLKISYTGDSGTSAITGGNDIVLYTAASGSAYDTWKAANAPGSNPDDDTDADGVSNAVEFVLGGTSLTKDLDKLPVPDASGSNLTFIFERAVSSIDPKTALFIETSTDLANWNTAPSPFTVPDGTIVGPPVTVVEDTPVGFDTVTLSVPKAPDAKKFARLKVVITP